MNYDAKKWNTAGLRYSITLMIVAGLIMIGGKIFNVPDVTWALISGIVCIELEVDQSQSIVSLRIFSTLIGVVIAILILLIIGPSYFGIILGILIITLLCHYGISLKNNWKLATATGVMVLAIGLQQNSLHFAEAMAFKRAAEVIVGSLTAGAVSWLFRKLFI